MDDMTPEQLAELFKTDPLEAVKTADAWSRSPDIDIDRYDAAVAIRDSQTVVPACDFCHWPIIEARPHRNCNYVMGIEQAALRTS
jgi:hypothetical protein